MGWVGSYGRFIFRSVKSLQTGWTLLLHSPDLLGELRTHCCSCCSLVHNCELLQSLSEWGHLMGTAETSPTLFPSTTNFTRQHILAQFLPCSFPSTWMFPEEHLLAEVSILGPLSQALLLSNQAKMKKGLVWVMQQPPKPHGQGKKKS